MGGFHYQTHRYTCTVGCVDGWPSGTRIDQILCWSAWTWLRSYVLKMRWSFIRLTHIDFIQEMRWSSSLRMRMDFGLEDALKHSFVYLVGSHHGHAMSTHRFLLWKILSHAVILLRTYTTRKWRMVWKSHFLFYDFFLTFLGLFLCVVSMVLPTLVEVLFDYSLCQMDLDFNEEVDNPTKVAIMENQPPKRMAQIKVQSFAFL